MNEGHSSHPNSKSSPKLWLGLAVFVVLLAATAFLALRGGEGPVADRTERDVATSQLRAAPTPEAAPAQQPVQAADGLSVVEDNFAEAATPVPTGEDETIPVEVSLTVASHLGTPFSETIIYRVGYLDRTGKLIDQTTLRAGTTETLQLPGKTEALAFAPDQNAESSGRLILPSLFGAPSTLERFSGTQLTPIQLISNVWIPSPFGEMHGEFSDERTWMPTITPADESERWKLSSYHMARRQRERSESGEMDMGRFGMGPPSFDVRAINYPDLTLPEDPTPEQRMALAERLMGDSTPIEPVWPAAIDLRLTGLQRSRLQLSIVDAQGKPITDADLLARTYFDVYRGTLHELNYKERPWLVSVYPPSAELQSALNWPRIASGLVVLDNLPPRAFKLRAVLPDGRSTEWAEVALDPGAHETLELKLESGDSWLNIKVLAFDEPRKGGKPVAGAPVELYLNRDRGGALWFTADGEPRWGRPYRGGYIMERPRRLGGASFGSAADPLGGDPDRVAVTNEEGIATFPDLAVEEYLALARPDGMTIGHKRVTPTLDEVPPVMTSRQSIETGESRAPAYSANRRKDVIIAVGAKRPKVEVRIEDAAGEVVPISAEVFFNPGSDGPGVILTDNHESAVVATINQGVASVELPLLGMWDVTATSKEPALLRPLHQRLAVPYSEEVRTLVFTAETSCVVPIRIVDEHGEPLPNIRLLPKKRPLSFTDWTYEQLITDDEGQVLLAVKPGDYALYAQRSRPNGYNGMSTLLGEFTADEPNEAGLEFVFSDSVLSVVVTDAESGEPVSNAHAVLMSAQNPRFAQEGELQRLPSDLIATAEGALTGRDGRVTFNPIPAGEYSVMVEADNYMRSELRVEMGIEDREVAMELEPGGATLAINVLDHQGGAVENVTLMRLVRSDGNAVDVPMVGTSGDFMPLEVKSLEAGRYRAELVWQSSLHGLYNMPALTDWVDVPEDGRAEVDAVSFLGGQLTFYGLSSWARTEFERLEAEHEAGLSEQAYHDQVSAVFEARSGSGARVSVELTLEEPGEGVPMHLVPNVSQHPLTAHRGSGQLTTRWAAPGRYRATLQSDELVIVPESFEFVLAPNERRRMEFEYDFIEPVTGE